MVDIVVIGAGMAGLTAAQQLQQAGYQVVVVDKSRGVGGRVATRRLHGTFADHGACFLKPEGEFVRDLVKVLVNREIVKIWHDTDNLMEADKLQLGKQYSRYVAPMGMSAIAKFLATNLDIRFNQRVTAISPTSDKKWSFTFEAADNNLEELTATAVIVAIPAPQALTLLETTLTGEFLNDLRSVEFAPCLSVMAGYPVNHQPDLAHLGWKAISFKNNSELAWIGLDSSKRDNPQYPVFVLQSTAEFAQYYLDTVDLNPVAQQMLSSASELLIPWLNSPDWFQIHRWRYAFPTRPLKQDCSIADTELPLVCCGDWCGGNLIESAMKSGLAAASEINQKLAQKQLHEVLSFEF